MFAELDPVYIRMSPSKAVSRVLSKVVFEGRPIPARWQWTNRIDLMLLRLATHMPEAKKISRPIFILGTGRSGTTILGKVLSMHPDVGFLNEPKLMWHIAYPDEDMIGTYTRGSAHYRLTADQVTEDVCRAIHRMYGLYLLTTGARRVLDRYPELIFRVPFVLAIFPDAKFLFLVRNGNDCARSVEWWCKQWSRVTKNGDIHDWWGVNNRKWDLLVKEVVDHDPDFAAISAKLSRLSRHVDRAAVEWTVTMREGLDLLKRFPQQVHLVRYEELTNRPHETLSNIAEFCELRAGHKILAYASRVLAPLSSKEVPDLDPAIRPMFEQTMRLMDYQEGLAHKSVAGSFSSAKEAIPGQPECH